MALTKWSTPVKMNPRPIPHRIAPRKSNFLLNSRESAQDKPAAIEAYTKALALLRESLDTADEKRRAQIFAELHGMMKTQVPTIGLYFEPTAAASQMKVKGWTTWPVDRPITWGVWKQ